LQCDDQSGEPQQGAAENPDRGGDESFKLPFQFGSSEGNLASHQILHIIGNPPDEGAEARYRVSTLAHDRPPTAK
jgi:hypothetical protein